MPSTTNSLPGYSCGVLRLFSIRSSTGAQTDGFAQRAFERRYLTMGGPELELGVARCAEFDKVFLAAVVQLDAGHRLRVAAIERLGEPQNRRQCADGAAPFRAQRTEIGVRFFWRRLAVIAGDERNRLSFCGLEAAKVAILDEVIRVLVMARITDVRA